MASNSELLTDGTSGAGAPNIGAVRPTDITVEMQTAYLDYAMSVIVARALPDVRDGLKPVHRRILYAMYHDLGLTHNKPHKKSARIVGEVLGKYHPHGDSAVYDAMVRMAQSFSLRYPLIDGQGNFGSIDGDNAAAMRYTEARLAEIADLMLEDLHKDTVDWHDNFDNTLHEPDILPAALPNLLVNGASGIAVGMSTNVPPHNLGEVVDATAYLIDHFDQIDQVPVESLLHFIKGPDFPTGGIVYRYRTDDKLGEQTDVIAQGYSVGKARLVVQAKAHFEEMSRGRSRIIVTELPYQTNKVALLERIASLARDEKIAGISDLRDESDRTGMRIVIELSRNVEPKDVLADLYKYTPLQQTFGMQILALVDGQPKVLNLKRVLHLFIQHRQEIIRRRSEFELARARERAHIVEGLLKALDILDEVIATIRKSQTVDTARANLVREFKFTEVQAQAILDMQLRRLAALERRKLQDEFKELKARIKYLEDLLAHPHKILALIKEDLLAIKEKYGDARRTQIVDRVKGTLTTTDLLPDQDVWVSVGLKGEVGREEISAISRATLRRAGRGATAAFTRVNTRDLLLAFTDEGRCRRIQVHEIPVDGGKLADLAGFAGRTTYAAALALPRSQGEDAPLYLFLATRQGMVKRVALTDLLSATAVGEATAINIAAGDALGWAFTTRGDQEVVLVADSGKAIRFDENEARSMGLAAGGVGGLKLGKKERLIYAGAVDPAGELLTVTASGWLKRSPLTDYPRQGRNGGGIVTYKPSARTGALAAAAVLPAAGGEDPFVLIVSAKGKAMPLTHSEIPAMGRSAQGKELAAPGAGDTVAAAYTTIAAKQTRPAPTPAPPPLPPQAVEPVTLATNGAAAETPVAAAPVKPVSNRAAAPRRAQTAAAPAKAAGAPEPAAAPAEATARKTASKSAGKPAGKAASKRQKAAPPAAAEGKEPPATDKKIPKGRANKPASVPEPPASKGPSKPAAEAAGPRRGKKSAAPATSEQPAAGKAAAASSPAPKTPAKQPAAPASAAGEGATPRRKSAATPAAAPELPTADGKVKGKAAAPAAEAQLSLLAEPLPTSRAAAKLQAATSVPTAQRPRSAKNGKQAKTKS